MNKYLFYSIVSIILMLPIEWFIDTVGNGNFLWSFFAILFFFLPLVFIFLYIINKNNNLKKDIEYTNKNTLTKVLNIIILTILIFLLSLIILLILITILDYIKEMLKIQLTEPIEIITSLISWFIIILSIPYYINKKIHKKSILLFITLSLLLVGYLSIIIPQLYLIPYMEISKIILMFWILIILSVPLYFLYKKSNKLN